MLRMMRSLLRPRHLALIASLSTGTALCYYSPEAGSAERLASWQERWDAGNIRFHKESVNRMLAGAYDTWCPDANASHRVLVPLCGKTVDMPWLASKGHEVVGVEGVVKAIEQFGAEHPALSLQPRREGAARPDYIRADEFLGEKPGYVFTLREAGLGYYLDSNAGGDTIDWVTPGLAPEPRPNRRAVAGGLWLTARDFFTCSRKQLGTFKRVWDRGSLVAVPPAVRGQYAATLDGLLEPGARILLSTFDYDQEKAPGPPFAAGEAEVRRLFPNYRVHLIARLDAAPEFRQRKGTPWERIGKMDELTWILVKKRPLWQRVLWPWPLGGRDQDLDLGD